MKLSQKQTKYSKIRKLTIGTQNPKNRKLTIEIQNPNCIKEIDNWKPKSKTQSITIGIQTSRKVGIGN